MLELEIFKTKPASSLNRYLDFSFIFILIINTAIAIDSLIFFLVYSVSTLVLILAKVAYNIVRLLIFNILVLL